MNGKYVGYVAGEDPLHGFLSTIMRDRLEVRQAQPAFRAFRLSGSNEVYAYEEKFSGTKIICKFYGTRFTTDLDKAAWMARQEYEGLETLRRYNLVGSPHHVIRPLGLSRDINGVLAVEYYSGEEFSHAIARATQQADDAHLYWRLKALAYFLATQHNRTANGATVDFAPECRYFDTIVGRLRKARRIGERDIGELCGLRDRWRDRPQMWQDRQVWLHGDATPANFLFGHDMDVAAIDLERMKRGDRMFDVGRVAGELQHAFMRDSGDKRRAEPFIGHFLWEYSCHFPDREQTFKSITARAPYYMALNLLRIARNGYIDHDYARRLVRHAKRMLRAALTPQIPSRERRPRLVATPCRARRPDVSMDIRAVAFDVNGTLVRILADDGDERIFRAAAHFLSYQGIDLHRHELRDLYFQIMKEQLRGSPAKYPEFDAAGIWRSIIEDHQTNFTRALPAGKLQQVPLFLAEMSRGISRRRLTLYPYVREVLDVLYGRYPLAIVTDAQSTYARGELHKVGLLGYFDAIIVSGDHGYRKPDRRLFQLALDGMTIAAENALYVGNDMYRDIYGAHEAGLMTVMFDSDQGEKTYRDCTPDYTITDFRDLLRILGLPSS